MAIRGLPPGSRSTVGGRQRCPACGTLGAVTLESRPSPRGLRRRRCCSDCGERFTTYELCVTDDDALDVLLRSGAGSEKLSSLVAKAMAYDEIVAAVTNLADRANVLASLFPPPSDAGGES